VFSCRMCSLVDECAIGRLYTRAHTYAHIHMGNLAHTHTRTHTHTHAHTHTQPLREVLSHVILGVREGGIFFWRCLVARARRLEHASTNYCVGPETEEEEEEEEGLFWG